MVNSGIIFNVQRFCIHDGPGIRSTVFFKGCPLSCKWCHNPESQKFIAQISFEKKLCIQCAQCAQVCEQNAHEFHKETHTIDFSKCVNCGKCISACAQGALQLIGETTTVSDVLQEVLKDNDFYRASGGGITLSGGEPLFQPEFSLSLLKAAKEHKLHTCVETCGFCSETVLRKLMEYVDLFMFDFKHYDEEQHHSYTGVPLSTILNNLKILNGKGCSVILRCPIIPTINDSLKHFEAIAQLSNLSCVNAVEIMPYHTMGVEKAGKIGQCYPLDIPAVSAICVQQWRTQLLALDCKKLIDIT